MVHGPGCAALALSALLLPATARTGDCDVRVQVASFGAEDGRVWDIVFHIQSEPPMGRGSFRFRLQFVDSLGRLEQVERTHRWEASGVGSGFLSTYQFLLNPGETVVSVQVLEPGLSCSAEGAPEQPSAPGE